MEASALTTASHNGLLARRSPLLRLQGDERLVALIREGHDRAFEVLFDRYQARLLSFCRHLLGSSQDAEDVLQEVFVAAHTAMLADERPINARPWLYRIARNRCLNHLRKPVADGQDSMDVHPHANGTNTFERVQRREELRTVVSDVQDLPETQRAALILREIDGLAYTEIAQAMGTSLPAVKSLLVRARMSLAEASESRILACEDVRLELAEAAEGLAKVTGPARRHVRDCSRCRRYRGQLRSTSRALGALAPFGLFAAVGKLIGSKFGAGSVHGSASSAGGAGGTGGAAGGGAGAAGAGAGAAGSVGGAAGSVGGVAGSVGGAAAAAGSSGIGIGGALGAVGGVVGAKAAVGVATAALITAGAVGAKDIGSKPSAATPPAPIVAAHVATAAPLVQAPVDSGPIANPEPVVTTTATSTPDLVPTTTEPPVDPTTTVTPTAEPPPTDVAPPVDPPVSTDPPPADQGTGTAVDGTGGTDTTGDGTSGDGDAGGSSTDDGGTPDPDPPPPYVDPPPGDGTTPPPDPGTLPGGGDVIPPPADG